ncbi:protein crossbronx homolog [Homalodisca vitripennis]|uniref:UBC core domain-containing protein n=1 Tax=Homalodisca liturata TaxID=320908 RepID=A0A1B6IUH5_9HEMI|nr:protein crossbronx homolog [Homalodisca vitripennis]
MASNSSQTSNEQDSSDQLRRQGSLRRVLPPNVNGEPVVGMSAKMIERPRPNNPNPNSSKHNYNQYFQEYSLIAEYNMLVNQRLPGLYVMPSANSALVWFCVLFVRKGLYQGGIFRFNLLIPEDFPNSGCPRVVSESSVFHPSVDPVTGEVVVASVFPEWRKDVNRLWQMLEHVVQMFCSIDTKNAVNIEAARLFEDSQEEFIRQVNECVELSQAAIYNPPTVDDAHYIKFDHFDNKIHDKVLTSLIEPKETPKLPAKRGLSWVQYGSLEPFSASHS